jgi:hypothetical protein
MPQALGSIPPMQKQKKQTKNKPSVLKDETVMKKHNKTLAKQTS